MDIRTVGRILDGALPMDIIRQLSSRGSFETLADAAEGFGQLNGTMTPRRLGEAQIFSTFCLFWASQRQELFEHCLRTYFPFWYDLPPKRRQGILMLDLLMANWTAIGLRQIIRPNGPIQPADTKAWSDDGVSILHVVFVFYLLHYCEADAGDCDTLLEEAIQATDDVHRTFAREEFHHFGLTESFSVLQAAIMTLLKIRSYGTGMLLEKRVARGKLEKMTEALQSLMSVVASCGYDLLEFGRREASTWVDKHNADGIVGDALYLGVPYHGLHVSVVHYGAEPRDWYFEADCHHEEYAGAFWNLIENACR